MIIGSGLTEDNAQELLSFADGAIVGSFFKEGNDWKNPWTAKSQEFHEKIHSLRRELSDD